MKTFEQQAELIRQEIDILRSMAFQTIKTINSTALADAYQIKQEANANATNVTIKAEQEAFLDAKEVSINILTFYMVCRIWAFLPQN